MAFRTVRVVLLGDSGKLSAPSPIGVASIRPESQLVEGGAVATSCEYAGGLPWPASLAPTALGGSMLRKLSPCDGIKGLL